MHFLSHRMSARPRALLLALIVAPILLIGPGADVVSAQASRGPFTRLPKVTASDAAPGDGFGSAVAMSGNVALVSSGAGTYIFERGGAGQDPDAWREVTKLTLPAVIAGPGLPGSGAIPVVAVTLNNALVGGPNGEVWLFDRNQGGQGAWGFVTTLVTASAIPARMAISGDTAVGTQVASLFGDWVVHIFQRNQGGQNAWGEVTTLTSPSTGFKSGFGITLAIDGNTLLVGETLGAALVLGRVFVYDRNRGGANSWGLVTPLRPTAQIPTFGFGSTVSLSGDTAVATGGEFETGVHIFERNRGGTDAWGAQTGFTTGCCAGTAVVSGDTMVVTSPVDQEAHLYARNQGGANTWGHVSEFHIGPDPTGGLPGIPVAVSNDTVLAGSSRDDDAGENAGAVEVFVRDVDRDDLRDGIDPCPRDPLNNIAGGCRRDAAASPIVDDRITLVGVQTTARAGGLIVTATFKNTSATAMRNPFVQIAQFTGTAILEADGGGSQGVGATLSPDAGDGLLSPGEEMIVRIVVTANRPFVLVVHVHEDAAP